MTALQAAYHGVPLVGMPLSGDQAYNVYAAVDRGVGLAVSTKDSAHLAADLQQAIGKVLNNAQYKQRSEALSTIMQARRFSPAELAAGEMPACILLQSRFRRQARFLLVIELQVWQAAAAWRVWAHQCDHQGHMMQFACDARPFTTLVLFRE